MWVFSSSFFFKKKFLADTCPFLGPLVPLFRISSDVSSGFQSQSGLPYSHCRGERNVRSLRSTSGATLADLLVASVQPVLSPHTVAEVMLPGLELVLSECQWVFFFSNLINIKDAIIYCMLVTATIFPSFLI